MEFSNIIYGPITVTYKDYNIIKEYFKIFESMNRAELINLLVSLKLVTYWTLHISLTVLEADYFTIVHIEFYKMIY